MPPLPGSRPALPAGSGSPASKPLVTFFAGPSLTNCHCLFIVTVLVSLSFVTAKTLNEVLSDSSIVAAWQIAILSVNTGWENEWMNKWMNVLSSVLAEEISEASLNLPQYHPQCLTDSRCLVWFCWKEKYVWMNKGIKNGWINKWLKMSGVQYWGWKSRWAPIRPDISFLKRINNIWYKCARFSMSEEAEEILLLLKV